ATSLNLNFATGGVLTAVKVQAGQKVAAGQVLATIDPSAAQVGLQSAKANLAAAQEKLTQAENPTTTTTAGSQSQNQNQGQNQDGSGLDGETSTSSTTTTTTAPTP